MMAVLCCDRGEDNENILAIIVKMIAVLLRCCEDDKCSCMVDGGYAVLRRVNLYSYPQ